MAATGGLVPTAERAIFLLTTPPKSFRHDQHRSVQVQRIVHQSDQNSQLRIRPIFNLEYHRLFATRIIELEEADAKIAEFHPSKGSHHDDRAPSQAPRRSGSKRLRTRSIDNKGGEYGGRVSSSSRTHGLCDMTVVGSATDGIFLFQCADGQALTWRKMPAPTGCRWQLEETATGPQTSDAKGHHRLGPETLQAKGRTAAAEETTTTQQDQRPRTSYEFGPAARSQAAMTRTDTSLTLASQYTTVFPNESQLSGLTNSPAVDERDIVVRPKKTRKDNYASRPARSSTLVEDSEDSHEEDDEDEDDDDDEEDDAEDDGLTTLFSHPMPHLVIALPEQAGPRHSMHDISRVNAKIYRILICVLWITWSTPDLVHDPAEALHNAAAAAAAAAATRVGNPGDDGANVERRVTSSDDTGSSGATTAVAGHAGRGHGHRRAPSDAVAATATTGQGHHGKLHHGKMGEREKGKQSKGVGFFAKLTRICGGK